MVIDRDRRTLQRTYVFPTSLSRTIAEKGIAAALWPDTDRAVRINRKEI